MSKILVGDIGGTNTRFALAEQGHDQVTDIARFPNAEFDSFEAVLDEYVSQLDGVDLIGVCIAAAGPVANGVLRMTNIDWVLSEADLKDRLGVGTALLINDLQAFAYASEALGDDDLFAVANADAPREKAGQNLVVNLGTGFNVSATMSSPSGTVLAMKCEIGHTAMTCSVRDALAADLSAEDLAELESLEHLFCGRGLEWLYRKVAGPSVAPLTGKAIVYGALADMPDATCMRVVQIYSRMMGIMCADMIKAFLPTGGLYFSGSVALMLRDPALAKEFTTSLEAARSLPNLPKHIYCGLINDGFAALRGCAVALRAEV